MGLAEMLEESLEIYRQNFALLFGLALIPALLSTVFVTIFNLWLTLPRARELEPLSIAATVTSYTYTYIALEPLLIAATVISYILLLVTAFIGYGAQIWAAGQIIMGKSVGFGEAWMAVLKRSGGATSHHAHSLLPDACRSRSLLRWCPCHSRHLFRRA
jgi:hypothetical protein